MYENALQRVLSMPELLDFIFGNLDRKSNINNACVCKQWSELCLDSLWREVEDIRALFNILQPLRKVAGARCTNVWEFVKRPEPQDWQRFERYAHRVRRLHYDERVSQMRSLQPLFDAVARTRTSLKILPNLHTLEWLCPNSGQQLESSVLFMHDSIKVLVIAVQPTISKGKASINLFSDIVARMPSLTKIDLRIYVSAGAIEDDLCHLFRHLSKLKTVIVPNYHITSRIVEELSRLEDLEVIQFEWGDGQGIGVKRDIESFAPTLAEGAFPSLYDLSLTARLEDVNNFMGLKFAPTRLTSLYVGSPSFESPSNVQLFLTTLSENCQVLQSLILELLDDIRAGPPSDQSRITLDMLRPVLALPHLTTFEMTHEYPLQLTQGDIEEIARSMPNIESLSLNCEPVVLDAELTLDALVPFAEHCPNLKHLGLFIHASSLNTTAITLAPQFAQLTKLSVGSSDIGEEGPVALALASLLPPGCILECGVTWYDARRSVPWRTVMYIPDDDEEENDHSEFLDEVARRCGKWSEVNRLLPLLTQMKRDEKQRTWRLKTEVNDLQTRNMVLMDKIAMRNSDGKGCTIM